MKIAFIGQEKCSISNMLALALSMHAESDKSILLLDIGFARTDLEDAFGGEDNLFVKEESYYGIREGMDYFLYRMKNGGYNSSITKEGVTFVTADFAYVKTAIKGGKSEYEHQIKLYIKTLLNEWNKEFDVVMTKCEDTLRSVTDIVLKNSDVCVACFDHGKVTRYKDLLQKISQKKRVYILIGQVIGSCESEKHFLTNICRINECKVGFIPYNAYFDMKIYSGEMLKLILNKDNHKASLKEFFRQLKNVLHKFTKWLEEIEYYG